MLSSDFIKLLEESSGTEICRSVCSALEDEPQLSVRANPFKISTAALREHFADICDEPVPWAENAFYLRSRPSFTLDPLFHCGAYYVQEASSMYAGSLVGRGGGRRILDLCAAPGGKSTHILSLMDDSDLLVSNEVMQGRVGVLASNVAAWGRTNAVVTSNDPSAFGRFESMFDIILVDAPCSGEGMFRKDSEAVANWSVDNVRLCAARQRRILSDVWPSLRPGGTLVYSTCTFNHLEDEDNALWICSALGGELLEQRHFFPGRDRGEGFYCAEIRKNSESQRKLYRAADRICPEKSCADFVGDKSVILPAGSMLKAYPENLIQEIRFLEKNFKVIRSGVAVAEKKGRDFIPETELAWSLALRRGYFPEAELSREDALKYLSREALFLPDYPPGFILVTCKGFPLGFVKNIGKRCNNMYPSSQRIRMQLG